MGELIKLHTLGVLAHGKKKKNKKAKYELPSIDLWDKDFCESLNSLKFDDEIRFLLYENDENILINNTTTNSKVNAIFEEFKDISFVEDIYIHNDLPSDIEFVRFTHTVILKNDDEDCAKKAADSIKQGLSILNYSHEIGRELLENNKRIDDVDTAKTECTKIKRVCALQANFMQDNQRKDIGVDNFILNELLQNADDKIVDGIMNITINNDSIVLEYNEKKGFTVKDFMAISTSGNSGNVDHSGNGNDNLESTGHKGTGFKAIYDIFEKVVIKSGYVTCTLDDTETVQCKFDITDFEGFKILRNGADEDKSPNEVEKNFEHKKYFPVPKFEFHKINENNEEPRKTTITLTFKSGEEDNKNKFIENNLRFEKFVEDKKYLFLNKISEFKISNQTQEETKTQTLYKKKYDKKGVLVDHTENTDESGTLIISIDNTDSITPYYMYSQGFEIKEKEFEENKRFKNKQTELGEFNENKCKVTVLFPMLKSNISTETALYCTLPVEKERFNTPFYLNCPAFELTNGRDAVKENEVIGEWNKIIWKKAIRDNGSAFSEIFKKFAKDYENTDISIYKYFPDLYLEEWECLKTIPFIKTVDIAKSDVDGEREYKHDKLSTIEQFKTNSCVFLPEFMYDWFKGENGYGGYKTNVDFFYTKDYDNDIKILKKMLSCYNYEEVVTDITKFLKSKLYKERDIFEFGTPEYKFLQKVYNDSEFNFDDKIPECYKWYLGETICESPSYSVKNISVGDYRARKNINEYKESIKKIFDDVNENLFIGIFTDLRKHLYLYNDEIVKPKDEFLNHVLNYYVSNNIEKSEIFKLASEEFEGKVNCDQMKELFEKGKIVVKIENETGIEFYDLSNKTSLYTSSFIKKRNFILAKPEWAKEYVENLDYEIQKTDFYKNNKLDFLKKVVPLYIESSERIKYIDNQVDFCESKELVSLFIRRYLRECKEITQKEIYLFEQMCDVRDILDSDVCLDWDQKFFKLLDTYNSKFDIEKENENTLVRFVFTKDKTSDITPKIKETFDDKIDDNSKNRVYNFLDEKLSLKEIVEHRVRICKDKSRKSKYCIGRYNEKDIIIIFGEDSMGVMLKDLFKCEGYIKPKAYTKMECYLPNKLHNDKYDEITEDIVNVVLNNHQKLLKYTEDEVGFNDLKMKLIHRFEFKVKNENKGTVKWYCFKGYGGDEQSNCICPVCKGELIAELTSCRIRHIQGIQGVHLPVLLCSNCNNSVQFANNVYFCDEEKKKYDKNKLIEDLKKRDNITICFDMYANNPKYFNIKMTLLHRLMCIQKLENSTSNGVNEL